MRRRYSTTTELSPGIIQTTERPARVDSVFADALRAALSGVFAALFAWPITSWSHGPWFVPLGVFALIAPIAWLVLNGRDAIGKALIAAFERQLHRDLDGDGEVGETETVRHLATVQIQDNGDSVFVGDIPLTRQMQDFAAAVLEGRAKFTERGALSYSIPIADFRIACKEMVARDVRAWKNPSNHRSGTNPRRGFREALEGLLPPHQELLA